MGTKADSLSPVKIAFDSTEYKGRVDSLIAIAMQQRSEIIDARNNVEALKIQEELAGKEMMPSLGASASTGVKNGYPIHVDDPKFNWVAAAQLHVPLYDGSRKKYHLSELKAMRGAAEEMLTEATDKARSDVLQALSDVTTAYARIASSTLQVQVTSESLRLAKLKLEAGTITNDEVLDTQRDYSQAKLMSLQDHARYTLSLFALNQATGVSVVR